MRVLESVLVVVLPVWGHGKGPAYRGGSGARFHGPRPWRGGSLLPDGLCRGGQLAEAGREDGDLRFPGDGRLGAGGVREFRARFLYAFGVPLACGDVQGMQRGAARVVSPMRHGPAAHAARGGGVAQRGSADPGGLGADRRWSGSARIQLSVLLSDQRSASGRAGRPAVAFAEICSSYRRAAFVADDEVYSGRQLHCGIRQRGIGYVLAVRANHAVTAGSGRTVTAASAAAVIPRQAWHRMRTGSGTKGTRHYDWAMLEVAIEDTPHGHGDGHSVLLVRRDRYTGQLSYYRCWTPGSARAVIDLAEAMGISAVAEGVETEDQLARLRMPGCPVAQGGLFLATAVRRGVRGPAHPPLRSYHGPQGPVLTPTNCR